jgi:hypothetical protein
MIHRLFLGLLFGIGLLQAGDRFMPFIDSRLESRNWRVELLAKHDPTHKSGFQYQIFERKGEIVIIYKKKNSMIKAISLKGERVRDIPISSLTVKNVTLKFGTYNFALVDEGEIGAKL